MTVTRDDERYRDLVVSAGLPLSKGNDLGLLVGGSQFVSAILNAIAEARASILVEVFTLRRGLLASTFVDALTESARRGVEVHVVLDAIGSRFPPSRLLQQLRRSGVTVHFFGRFMWSNPRRYLVRNHRKTFTIDHQVAFVGGMSIDDVFIGGPDRPAWHEVMLMVRGPLAADVADMFGATYTELSRQSIYCRPCCAVDSVGLSGGVLLASEPGVTRGRDAYLRLLRSAERSIELTTPYFAPEETALTELVGAAKRGVDVRIITAGVHTNARIVRSIAHSYYSELLAAGIRVVEPATRMTHAKTVLVDKSTWIVGSTNIDSRSFFVNLEADILGCDGGVAAELSKAFALLEAESEVICKAEIDRFPKPFVGALVRRFARYV